MKFLKKTKYKHGVKLTFLYAARVCSALVNVARACVLLFGIYFCASS